jgi:hypothetical protein
MIVLGADMHKQSHTVAAIGATTGEVLGEQTVRVGDAGFSALLSWARSVDEQRSGRWRTAGMCPARLSGSCSPAASAWCAWRPS